MTRRHTPARAETIASSRIEALLMGARKYHGQRCALGHTTRYAADRKCVDCKAARNAVYRGADGPPEPPQPIGEDRNSAEWFNLTKYHGPPCPAGHTVRYTRNSSCVECQCARAAARYHRRSTARGQAA